MINILTLWGDGYMSKISLNVSIAPLEALDLVKDNQNADLVHEEYNVVGQDKLIGTQIYEKYYFRSKNRAALIVIIDNLKGPTNVRAIAIRSSEGWGGAADNFVTSVEKILGDLHYRVMIYKSPAKVDEYKLKDTIVP
jgi:hypothetical protein